MCARLGSSASQMSALACLFVLWVLGIVVVFNENVGNCRRLDVLIKFWIMRVCWF